MSDLDTDREQERLPRSKEELLERIQRAWTDLNTLIAALPAEAIVRPGRGGWSVKDNLAHLAAWEQFMLGRYLALRPAHRVWGVDEETLRGLDEDGLNQVVYERNRDRSTAEALSESHRSHAQVIEVLQAVAWENLLAPFPEDPQGRPVLTWVIGNTYEHYDEHRNYIIEMQTPSVLGD